MKRPALLSLAALSAMALAVLIACVQPTDGAPVETSAAAPPAAADCASSGGEMKPVCRRQVPMCVIRYADAGKACDDDADCQGRCLVEGTNKPPDTPATGVCQKDSDPCGCFTPVVGGRVGNSVCVD